ncbi:ethanolamine ammonia-lyase subunit EutC [Vibrio hangzhouensis]|uniref:Ethanolamine ammonia-lyase small subunit n=1 Tax=Vibrio hangzhouensis TaxID=462991 RepID=A0A1H6B724_9VIBR|nr:ethanolamine ammonia-lyase subunit EutC [Vibrio hangzhouensis]SEG56608.1 Ethanolamine ammonia-lyase light chain [Vibrio hangzhouensis]
MTKVINIKTKQTSDSVVTSPWQQLRNFTSARIALGRTGNSIPTDALLSFQLDHAQAMDAVHCALDTTALRQTLTQLPQVQSLTPSVPQVVESKISDRLMYLQRPDLGRQLNPESWQRLVKQAASPNFTPDLAIVVADGLSSTAIQHHAAPFIERLLTRMSESGTWLLAPITIVKQGRVAVADDVAECFGAKMVLVLIGERPGLSSPDSMGLYLTWGAKRGSKDSERNCISNIRPEGLSYDDACNRTMYLLEEARRLHLSGVNLKDRSDIQDESGSQLNQTHTDNFLITHS